MLRLKQKLAASAVLLTLSLGVSASYAQKAAAAPKSEEDKMAREVIHEKPNEFKIIASRSPVKAFVVLRDVVWFATDEIVICQSLVAAKGALHQQYQKLDKIASTGVTSMAGDNQGNVWMAGEEGVAVARGKNITSYTASDGIPEGKVLAVAPGSGLDIWIGTENGAARFNGSSWTKYTTSDGLPSNLVQAIVANSRGDVYLGTNKGLSVFNGSSFQNYNAKNTGNSGLEWNNIKVLAKEPNSDIVWMTDGPKNLNTFDGKTWKRYVEIKDGITCIMNDTRRTWFGSEDGLIRFNGEEWVEKKEQLGVPVEQVYAMQRDSNGNLCFGMEKGVLILSNPYRK